MEEGETLHFVELECLKSTENGFEWKEQARWIKLEEDIEHGSGRWSKPYVPTISYRSVQKCKELLQNCIMLLDIDVETLDGVATEVCTALINNRIMEKEFFNILKATILARHHHHCKNQNKNNHEINICHREVMPALRIQNAVDPAEYTKCVPHTIAFLEEDSNSSHVDHSLSYMSEKSEASTVLVANVPYVQTPVIVFVRLVNSRILGNLNEISLPVKCLFLVLAPDEGGDDEYQIGRTIGVMLTDKDFANLSSLCQTQGDMLSGMEAFLLNSSLIPPGQWEHQLLMQSVSKWLDHMSKSTKAVLQRRRTTMCEGGVEGGILKPQDEDPLEKTGHLFGGLVKDMKRKLPHIRSDFTDAINFRCLIAVVFIYFSFLAPAITFAALLSKETKGLLGISEMIVATSVSGIIFGIFAGQPLIILGATGPLLVMEESIFDLAQYIGIEFLPWRVWIGFWITIFCTIIVAFDLSYLVRKFTLFTEEVVTALISTVFIHESLKYISREMSTYYFPNINNNNMAVGRNSTKCFEGEKFDVALPLMTIVLMIGTFLVCYNIRKLRHSQFFPSRLRRLVSDFGIALAVLLFQLLDIWMKDDYTTKLDIPNGFTPTTPSKRGWLIDVMGKEKPLSAWEIILASVPAMLVTVILFMETELTGTIVDRKEYKLKKGSGYNLDLLIVGILATFCSLFGLPWMCACPVHSISHLNSLTVWNQAAPGTRPQVKKVIEQRVTNIIIHLLIGVSVVLAPLLREIPLAVLYGVFLYLGITALSHLRLTERVKLLFIQAKYHPDYRFIRKVRTRQVHLFTGIQLLCLIVVIAIKNSILAPTFPFFIVLMVPLRSQLKRFFTEEELEELDTDTTDDLNDDNLDEYDIVHVPM